MRIIHFSDLHVGLGLRRVPVRDWPGKRVAGGLNLLRGRGRVFADSVAKTRALVRFEQEMRADFALCTGDLTGLATNAEFDAAFQALMPLSESSRFVVIPGNHDLYTRSVVRQRRFERRFGLGLSSDLPDLCTDGPWPLVRLPGEGVVVIAVNSARPNRAPWRSSGRIPAVQLRGLETALADPRVRGRFVFLMTHYAPCRADGSPDSDEHGLRNVTEFLEATRGIEGGALLCGHIHTPFRRQLDGFAGEVFCAGSATADSREGLWVFDRGPDGLWSARLGSWNGHAYAADVAGRPVAGSARP